MSAPSGRQRREGLFQRIAGRRGGAAGVLLSDMMLKEATARMEELRPAALGEIKAAISRIRALADSQDAAGEIFAASHHVRGLAGSYGLGGVGVVAGAIRTYGDNCPEGFEPDWLLIQLLSKMLARAFDHPGEVPVEALLAGCRQAVFKAMGREGREAPEGAL